MLRKEIFDKLKDILIMMDESKKDKIDLVTEDSRLYEDIGLTSISLLYLMIAVEESFNIEFDDDVGVSDLPRVKDVIDYIEKKTK